MEKSGKTLREDKRKKKKSRKGFITFLICIFVFYIILNIAISSGDRIETMIVRTGTEEESIKAKGYLFKEQTVINSPDSGYLYCEADEDERVKIGETVAYVYKKEIDSSASSELKSLETEIKKLSAGSQTSDFYSRDTAKIEQTISQELKNISLLGYQNRMEDIAEICEKVDALIESRRVITGETEAKDSALELENLKKRKAELEAKYNIERTAVHAPKAGVFTARVDGLEEILTNQALKELSPASIKELDKKSVQAKVSSKVESGKPIGKIVNNFNWNIGVLVPFEFAEDMDEGDTVDIRFTDIDVKTIKGTITRISPEEGGKVVLVINTNKYVDMIYSSSRVNVEIIKNKYE